MFGDSYIHLGWRRTSVHLFIPLTDMFLSCGLVANACAGTIALAQQMHSVLSFYEIVLANHETYLDLRAWHSASMHS